MLKFLFIPFLFLSVLFIHAQTPKQTVRGNVIDAASNAPVPYAAVVILNTQPLLGATTDSLGNFEIKRVPVGRYDIKITFVGYEPSILREIQVSSAKECNLSIPLKETLTTLREVTVKPTVNKESSLNPIATVSARMLSVDEASRYAGGFDDPARLASSFAGVASNVGNNGIVVRGNAPKSLQWKMEGVEIPNPNHFADMSVFGGGGLTALSSQMLANSDFLTGAFPADYNNALSGYFDIFMRTGNNTKRESTFQIGAIGIEAASEGPFKKGGKASYLFNYRYSTMALLGPLMPDNGDKVRYQDLSFKLNFPTQKAGTFALWGIGLIDYSGAKIKSDTTQWKYLSDRDKQHVYQSMGAMGLTHKYFFNNTTYLKSSLAGTVSGIDMKTERLNSVSQLLPQNQVTNTNWNFVLNSFLNKKFSALHTNKTGITVTGMLYNLLQRDVKDGEPYKTITDKSGFTTLLSAYSNSTLNLSDRLTINLGLTGQYLTLNKHTSIEPRVGVKWQTGNGSSFGFGYGLHSRMEMLNYYFATNPTTGNALINKNLDFTKAHHFVLSYDQSLGQNMHLKIEPYYQYLFNVPVVAGTSTSVINIQNDWFFNDKLQNTGKGRNYGVDATLEKYMSNGYYFLLTGSLFKSQYKGGDNIWRSTRYNRGYLFNFLIGKEWQTGRNKQNTFSANVRTGYQGGDHYSPIDQAASIAAQETKYDDTKAFSQQFADAFTAHFTVSFKMNKQTCAHEFAIKVLNATQLKEFTGFEYNYKSQTVDKRSDIIFIPNLSYKIEF
ncbi:MAG: TonB-dependent receptor [Paludibacteraceae bacterium]